MVEPREIHWEPRALARLIDEAPLAIYVKDARGRLAYVNDACALVLGRPLEELMGQHEENVLPRSVLGRLQRNDAWVLRHGRQLDLEEVVPQPGGSERTFLTHRVPMRSETGETVAVVAYSMEITDRKRIEEHLRRREASLAEAQQIAGVGSWSWDVESGEMRWSDEMHRIAGISAEQFRPTFERWMDIVDESDRERVAAAVEATLAGRRPFEIRYRLARPAGGVRMLHSRGEVNRAPDGRAVRFHGTCMDITEAWQLEERLRRSQSRLAGAQRLARLGAFEWDYDMDALAWSDELARILGLDPATVPPEPRRFLDAMAEADAERLRAAVQRALDDRRRFEVEVRITRPDREVRDVVVAGRAVTGDRGEATVITGVAQDVTSRRRETHDLHGRLRLLEASFDAVAAAAGALDRSGRWVAANRALAELSGRAPGDLVGHAMVDALAARERGAHEDRLDEMRSGQRDELTCRFEIERPRPQATPARVAVEARLVAARDRDGALEHVVVTLHDLTGRIRGDHMRSARLRLAEIAAADGELGALLETAGTATGARAASVWICDAVGGSLRPGALWTRRSADPDDWDDDAATAGEPKRIASGALAAGGPVAVALESGGVAHAQPIAADGDVLGAVELVHDEPGSLDEPQRGVIEALALHTGQLIARRRADEDLRHRALHDPLTGLPNRALLRDRVEQALGRMGRERSTAALLFVDCDDFKTVNDTYGHAAGDEALRAVAGHIAALIRPGDTLARVGGDEFVVLAERVAGTVEAVALCERLLRDVAVPIDDAGGTTHLTLSVGACLFDGTAGSVNDVLQAADAAMYDAKAAGGDSCRLMRRVG